MTDKPDFTKRELEDLVEILTGDPDRLQSFIEAWAAETQKESE